ncbi:ATP-binding protein [Bacillus swezeyi]|uniref:ATP-binding protein n=1 Tax=Bacillus swezeyi TaxID=1925020 RepID=UPI0039C73505
MLKNIKIKKFRNFKYIGFQIPSRLTLISGANGIGKSTVLGIIANGSGTKKYKTLTTKEFHPDFNSYFVLSKDEHKSAKSSDEYYEVILEYEYDEYPVYKRVRTSHPNENRLKLVPRTTNADGVQSDEVTERVKQKTGITASGRIPLPTYYLSISRLFPFGESGITDENLTKVTSRKLIKDQQELIKSYIDMYNRVLPRSFEENSNDMYEVTKPQIGSGLYIKPHKFDLLTQSIGQDSLSGIINALLSFKNISTDPNYKGGMLCIDELDASLHPDAQRRLLSLLKEQAEELNLQIIFTSHSLTIIKEMLDLQIRKPDKYAVLYFRDNSHPYLSKEDTYTSIKADLFSKTTYSMPKVKVYLEDEEAKFSFEQFLKIFEGNECSNSSLLNQCELIASQINCDTLMKLPQKDSYFQDIIIVLDGDAKYKNKPDIYKFLLEDPIGYNPIKTVPSNVIFLPDDFSPEESLFRGLYKISKEEEKYYEFWRSVQTNAYGLTNYYPYTILNELEDSIANKELHREAFKTWFEKHKSFFEQSNFLKYYYEEVRKKNEISEFGKKFNQLFNITLARIKRKGF